MSASTLRQPRILAYIAWLCVAAPPPCYANTGVPMIFVTLPAMVIALVPIILVEALLAVYSFKLPYRRLVRCFLIANLVSTFVGIPVAWFLLVVTQLVTGGGRAYGLESPSDRILAVTWQAPWLIPYRYELNWMIPAAMLFLLIPFFLSSWWLEYLVVKRVLPEVDKCAVRRSVRNVNFVSYGALALVVLLRMFFNP